MVAIPLIPFTIPRLFTGAEANYHYVPPWVMLQDVVHFFGMGMTTDFSQVIIKLLDVIAFGLLLLGLYAARAWKHRAFLLVYLLAVVLGLMIGSLLKPMYQGVRHIMVGSPAFTLLVSWGVIFLWGRAAPGGGQRWLWRSTAVIALLLSLSLIGPFIALNNLYNDDTYAKSNFRDQIQHIEKVAGSNDVIVYNDAIILPLHEHYQTRPDIALTALPVYPHIAVVDDPHLEALTQTYDRIWFVPGEPAGNRDKDRLVQIWLKNNLPRVGIVGAVSAYATAPATATGLPTDTPYSNTHPLSLLWEGVPPLLGIQFNFTQPAALSSLWLDLFWQGGTPPDPDMNLRFSLRDQEGVEWSQMGFLLNRDKKLAWPTDGLVRQSYLLPVALGTPPGVYRLFIQPLLNDVPVGEEQKVAAIALAPSSSWPMVAASLPDRTMAIVFDNGLTLQEIELFDLIVRPGHTLPLNLYWQARDEADWSDIRYQLDVVATDGEVLRTQQGKPGPNWLTIWPLDTVILGRTGLYFPPEAEPGHYRLRWQLFDGEEGLPGRPSWRPWSSESIIMGEIEVTPWPLVTDLPDNVTQIQAMFGSFIQLSGYDLTRLEKERLQLDLAWQVQAQPDDNYALFVHLIETGSGEIAAQADLVPGNGLRPTRGWRAGEVITDTIILDAPSELTPGGYQINVGLYNPGNGVRLPVMYQDKPQPHDQLALTTFP